MNNTIGSQVVGARSYARRRLAVVSRGVLTSVAALIFFGCAASWQRPTVESAAARAALPMYKVIPAARDSELTAAVPYAGEHRTWWRSNADPSGTRYSALDQIHRKNVASLEVAWIYYSGGGSDQVQANPVIVNGVIYGPTASKEIVALDGETGREIWRFRPEASDSRAMGPAKRGLIYWPGEGQHQPRLYFASGTHLYALDPQTGQPVASFGNQGKVPSDGVVAPAVYQNILVVPNQSVVDAFDVLDGTHLWSFKLMRQSSHRDATSWAGMAMDVVRGIAYIQVGDPHLLLLPRPLRRPERNEHSNSVVALDARSGRLLWAFQDIPHDIWDLDISAPPILVTVTRGGRRVDAVAQVTKQGNTLLLDRLTGKPLFPFRLRRAPVSKIPGERTWPYQPALELPEPFSRQVFSRDDITDLTPEARAFVEEELRGANFGWFEPFEDGRPTILYGLHGGAEWGGGAFDPATGWLYVSANDLAMKLTVTRNTARKRDPAAPATAGQKVFSANCAVCHGMQGEGMGVAPALAGVASRLEEYQVVELLTAGQGAMPPMPLSPQDRQALLDFLYDRDIPPSQERDPGQDRRDVPTSYALSVFTKLFDDRGYPGTRPPWGTLNAIDLNTGKLAWKIPLGEYEALTRQGIATTGTPNVGGATVTAGGLVFCAGTQDQMIRAFDKTDGRELWRHKLPYAGYAAPATYEVNGRQFVVIAATGGGKMGGKRGDAYVAFALPER